MKKNKNSLKQSLIQVKNSLIIKDLEDSKNKKTQNQYLYKKESLKKDREDKILRNAYKNVINVITNFLDNIEDEKTNGKINIFGTHRIIENKTKNNINKNKKPIKKIISDDLPKIKLSLNQSIKTDTFDTILNNTSSIKSPLKLSINWKSQKDLSCDNINNSEVSEYGSSVLNSSRSKKNHNLIKKIYKKFAPENKNLFFRPNNKLLIKCNSSQNKFNITSINNKKTLDLKNLNYIINANTNKYGSSLSSKSNYTSYRKSLVLKTKKNNSTILDDEINNHIMNTSNSNPANLKENYNNNNDEDSPFSNVQVKIKNIDSEKNISQNFDKNSDNNGEINLTTEELLNKNIKKMGHSENNMKKIITLKSCKNNITKTLYKEKKYRCLLYKGYVYDSLDDEEESDEEEINNCYLNPKTKFLYILDSITLISSFIILFYLPIYLSKRLFFCQDLTNKNEIIFYFIDVIYIIDLILNFFRSYYNFDEILVKKNVQIFIHYFKTWLFLDIISSIPIYTIIKKYENKCIGDNYYNDFKLNNNGQHSHYYNINLNNIHYILLLIKVIKTFKIFKNNIAINIIKKLYRKIDLIDNWANVLYYVLFFFFS